MQPNQLNLTCADLNTLERIAIKIAESHAIKQPEDGANILANLQAELTRLNNLNPLLNNPKNDEQWVREIKEILNGLSIINSRTSREQILTILEKVQIKSKKTIIQTPESADSE